MVKLFVVGLTGGIASGKSTVSKFLENNGVSLLNADLLGHEAYLPGTQCLKDLVSTFGKEILSDDGSVNRQALGKIVFSDPANLQKLNDIVWPAIRALIVQRLEAARVNTETTGTQIVVLEAAIMFEAGWEDLVDEVWVVATCHETALIRLMARNNLSKGDAESRINAQMAIDERASRGHLVINNDETQEHTESTLRSILDRLNSRLQSLSAFEEVDVVNQENIVLRSCKRAVVREYNLCHRATYMVVFQSGTNKVFVQTRSMTKDYCPGLMDPAPGGVVSTGEDPLESASRELEEEMGISGVVLKSHGVYLYSDDLTKCFCYVYSCVVQKDVDDLKLQEEEVESVQLMTESEILSQESGKFLPDGLAAFQHVVSASRGKM